MYCTRVRLATTKSNRERGSAKPFPNIGVSAKMLAEGGKIFVRMFALATGWRFLNSYRTFRPNTLFYLHAAENLTECEKETRTNSTFQTFAGDLLYAYVQRIRSKFTISNILSSMYEGDYKPEFPLHTRWTSKMYCNFTSEVECRIQEEWRKWNQVYGCV